MTFLIESPMGRYQLKALSVFSRAMTLQGPNGSVSITPNSIFTRRATILGELEDIEGTSFATWITLLLWRRNSNKSH